MRPTAPHLVFPTYLHTPSAGVRLPASLPLQLVGVCYSAYFWWRYVLFAEGRRELGEQVDQLRGRLAHRVDELAEKTSEQGGRVPSTVSV